jgi:potassium-transporting ATPase KdpC subunit
LSIRRDLVNSALAVVLFTVVFGLAYPLAFTGVAQVLFPGKADGSKIERNGTVVGSKLIAQDFRKPVLGKNGRPRVGADGKPVMVADPRYFQSRPSQTGYTPNVTFFSNLGPNSTAERDAVKANMAAYLALERRYDPQLTPSGVPADAVTQSGSGVDPQISQANARIQAHRIAAVRHLPLARVQKLIDDHTDGRFLGIFGEPGVNVLELNLAVDKEAPRA